MARHFFLLCHIFTCCLALVIGQSTKYALKGKEVMFTPNIPGPPKDILWKHNGNKVVEFNGQEQEVYGSYEARITLDWHTAELNIIQLGFEDSGDYELEAFINSKLHRSVYKLEVIDEVAEPTISCVMNDGTSSNRSGTLMCSAEPRQPQNLIKFAWNSDGKVQPGPQLAISLGGEYDDEVHVCSVSNPLSSKTATLTAKDCYPGNSQSVALIVGLVILFILVLVALGILYCHCTHKACFAKERRDVRGRCSQENSTVEDEERKSFLERAPTLPSTRPLAGLQRNGTVRPCDSAGSQEEDMSSDNVAACDLQDETPRKGSVRKIVKQLEQGGLEKSKDENKETASVPPLFEESSATAHGDSDHEEKARTRKHSDESAEGEGETVESKNEIQCGPKEEKTESEKEEDEDEEAKSPLANVVPPVAQPRSFLNKNSTTMAPDDPTAEHMDDTNLDQLNEETARNLRESDFSGKEKTAESNEDEQSSTIPKQEGSETTLPGTDSNLSQSESDTNKGGQQEKDKPVCAVENKSESEDNQQALCAAGSQQPESHTLTIPDNRSTNSSQGSSGTAHGDSDHEEEDRTTTEGEGETVESKNEIQCGPKEEKTEKEVPKSAPEPGPAGPETGLSEVTASDVESSSAPEQPELEKEEDEDEEAKSPLANVVPPVAQPRSFLNKNSTTMAPDDPPAEHMDDTNLDLDNRSTNSSQESLGIAHGDSDHAEEDRITTDGYVKRCVRRFSKVYD